MHPWQIKYIFFNYFNSDSCQRNVFDFHLVQLDVLKKLKITKYYTDKNKIYIFTKINMYMYKHTQNAKPN